MNNKKLGIRTAAVLRKKQRACQHTHTRNLQTKGILVSVPFVRAAVGAALTLRPACKAIVVLWCYCAWVGGLSEGAGGAHIMLYVPMNNYRVLLSLRLFGNFD